jgi:hypothetical protein
VDFLDFDVSAAAIAEGKSGAGAAMLVIDHPKCGHAGLIGPDVRDFLAAECFRAPIFLLCPLSGKGCDFRSGSGQEAMAGRCRQLVIGL